MDDIKFMVLIIVGFLLGFTLGDLLYVWFG